MPHGYCRPRIRLPPDSVTVLLPTTANGTLSWNTSNDFLLAGSSPSLATFFHWDLVMKKHTEWPFSPFPWFKKGSCQLLAKVWALSTGKLLTDRVRNELKCVDGPKNTNTTNQPINIILFLLNFLIGDCQQTLSSLFLFLSHSVSNYLVSVLKFCTLLFLFL